MKEKIKNTKGITLIALVVTIIILLILAGVAINAAIGDNGLFSQSKKAAEKHKEEAAMEKINMALGEFMLDINSEDMTEEEQDNHLKEILSKLGPTSVASDPKYYEVEVDEYLFWVDIKTGEVKRQGPAKSIEPETITVTNSTMEITVGETKIIEITMTPEDASRKYLKYTTSDANKATVQNGAVTGVGKGTATITIESTEDSSIKATLTVNVKEVEAESISLEPKTLALKVGKTSEAIGVTFTPWNTTNKTITWSTSNAGVATVENGVVTANSVGTATITATTSNNITDTCEVTVEENVVTSISLNPTELTVNIGETTTEAIGVTYVPDDADGRSVTWSSDNRNIATVSSDGKVTGVAYGITTITATTPNEKTAECTVTVLDPDAKPKRAGDITIYPKYDYGKEVTGYSFTDQPTSYKWRLFYVDNVSTTDKSQDTVYLIGDFITTNQAPDKAVGETKYSVSRGNNDKCLKFPNGIEEVYTSQWVWNNQQTIASKWLKQWYDYGSHTTTTGDNENMKATAYMMDTEIWKNKFGDTNNKANYVLGGPTIEMYCASYKDSHPSKYLESYVEDDKGYKIRWIGRNDTSSGSFTYQNGLDEWENNSIYTPGTRDDPFGMYIASPSKADSSFLMHAGCTGWLNYSSADADAAGFCPIVCLNSGVQIEPSADRFIIKQNHM